MSSVYAWAGIKIVSQLLKVKVVDATAIMGAVGGYLLIGLAGSFINAFINVLDPTAFSDPSLSKSVYSFVYYTFVTYTTLGYGDILPESSQARSISILISISGQIYLTILMAILVGKYLFSFDQETEEE
jgi:hypothetical protein